MNKERIREAIRERKRQLSREEILSRSRRLAGRLLASPQYRQARTVYGYYSCNQEVCTGEILLHALADGKGVALPRVCGKELRFFLVPDLSAVEKGFSGIMEPVKGGPEAEDPQALVLVPGLAFDPRGYRVGYGGGYYDRFLAREPDHPTVALCYDFQMLTAVPAEVHDIPVELVLRA